MDNERIKPTISLVKVACSDHCSTEAPIVHHRSQLQVIQIMMEMMTKVTTKKMMMKVLKMMLMKMGEELRS
jgi:hypothetical protein